MHSLQGFSVTITGMRNIVVPYLRNNNQHQKRLIKEVILEFTYSKSECKINELRNANELESVLSLSVHVLSSHVEAIKLCKYPSLVMSDSALGRSSAARKGGSVRRPVNISTGKTGTKCMSPCNRQNVCLWSFEYRHSPLEHNLFAHVFNVC